MIKVVAKKIISLRLKTKIWHHFENFGILTNSEEKNGLSDYLQKKKNNLKTIKATCKKFCTEILYEMILMVPKFQGNFKVKAW